MLYSAMMISAPAMEQTYCLNSWLVNHLLTIQKRTGFLLYLTRAHPNMVVVALATMMARAARAFFSKAGGLSIERLWSDREISRHRPFAGL